MFVIQKNDQERQQERRPLHEHRRESFSHRLMTDKAEPHANEHAHQHEIGKVSHVPDIACQVTNQHQFQEKHQEGGKEETHSRPWGNHEIGHGLTMSLVYQFSPGCSNI